jgi:hypothetical protein
VDATKNDTFFLPTHREVYDIVRERAQNPDGFVAAQLEKRQDA